VFHRKSFSGRSFNQIAWRFPAQHTPWEEAPVQPGAFAPLSRPSSPISRPFQRRSKKRREEDFLLL
jgi:hypothetical protein